MWEIVQKKKGFGKKVARIISQETSRAVSQDLSVVREICSVGKHIRHTSQRHTSQSSLCTFLPSLLLPLSPCGFASFFSRWDSHVGSLVSEMEVEIVNEATFPFWETPAPHPLFETGFPFSSSWPAKFSHLAPALLCTGITDIYYRTWWE